MKELNYSTIQKLTCSRDIRPHRCTRIKKKSESDGNSQLCDVYLSLFLGLLSLVAIYIMISAWCAYCKCSRLGSNNNDDAAESGESVVAESRKDDVLGTRKSNIIFSNIQDN